MKTQQNNDETASASQNRDIMGGFFGTTPEFQKQIRSIANESLSSVQYVYALWKEYASSGQSASIAEFKRVYADQIGSSAPIESRATARTANGKDLDAHERELGQAVAPEAPQVTVRRTFRAPSNYGNAFAFTITAQTHKIGEQAPYFSVTGDIYHKATRTRTGDGTRACGCLHEDALKMWPKIAPIIRLHLCDATTGAPTHAAENGYYWLAGAAPLASYPHGLGERYHGGTDKNADECLRILADHLRISEREALDITARVSDVYQLRFYDYLNATNRTTTDSVGTVGLGDMAQKREDAIPKARQQATTDAKAFMKTLVDDMRPRWKAEADAGIELLRSLTSKPMASTTAQPSTKA